MALCPHSASASFPSSSAPRSKHDVFLSFRGEDTRKGVVSYLYHKLENRGIQTFMDDQGLQQGMPISPSLVAAIEESRYAIVLLSPNYASSTWCLDELVKILQCSEAKKTPVLPIFYYVDPSDVRNQRGSFAEAFTKHEERYRQGNDDVEKVKKWRAALTQVANLSGLDSNKFGSDRELVQRIVELVCRDVRPISIMSSSNFEAFESTRKAMNELMEALEDDEVAAIGVYGMGGVGKTTMVKHFGAQAQKMGLFDHVIMAVVSQTPDKRNIQGALADLLGLKLVEETEIGRASRLQKEILRRSKILIILDDIWNRLELSSIGIPSYNELQICNSKVLLTTRRLNVCHTMESQAKIHLSILSEEDAWNLFLKKAGKSFRKSTAFYEVARKVARECAGLPVALIAVARALGDKDFEAWKEAARQLEMSQPANPEQDKDVFKCIKLSYDYLDDNADVSRSQAKYCFLLCCLFPEDYDIQIEDIMKYVFRTGLFRDDNSTIENARANAKSVIDHLKDSCLLLDGSKVGCIKMHDVIRDIAVSIASDGQHFLVKTRCDLKDWPMDAHEGCSAISLIESNICKLPNKLVCSKLQILLLQQNACIIKIPKTFFQCPNDLRVLDLSNTGISSLPPSFSLLTTLQALQLDNCRYLRDISILRKLKKLEILSMRDCSIKKFPKEIGNLTKLRMLDLTKTSFETVPSQVITRLYKLEELYMNYSFGYWGSKVKGGFLCFLRKNAKFDELTVLSRLNTLEVSVYGVECLPQNVEPIPNWVNFYIRIRRFGFRNSTRGDHIPHPSSRALIIDTTMNNLPNWFISVVTEKTEDLWYNCCNGLTNLLEEHDRGRLHGLKYLCLESVYAEVLFNTITWPKGSNEPVFEHLEELKIYFGHCLEELCVGDLPTGSVRNLKILNVQSCSRLVKPLLPSKLLHRLQSLEKLVCSYVVMNYVFGFEGDEPQHVVFTKLRMISLRQMYRLINIWNGPAPPGIFQSLKIFYLKDCPILKYLFTSEVARCLLQLEDVWVECCSRLDRLIEATEETESNKIVLPQLKNLVLKRLLKLTRFSSTSSSTIIIEIECPSLQHLYVDECPWVTISASDFSSRNQVPRFPISASGISSRNQVQLNDHQHMGTLRGRIDNESKLSHFPLWT
ncbi:disease resistance protein At4g27190 isoform X1 [Rosa chinensis]|uniref:disease resistance protein At4g27190 isoform X1 n=1 Tax=Rosa chinensis TaxID=74649 RepID=UPI000D090F0D|nr:disease resistance protein At4g27190 isoform X1 [Rosa chinensis]XP_040361448.1 disease resistance protein At4g27190 isoform X1 [Rosa chinensis]